MNFITYSRFSLLISNLINSVELKVLEFNKINSKIRSKSTLNLKTQNESDYDENKKFKNQSIKKRILNSDIEKNLKILQSAFVIIMYYFTIAKNL